MDMWSWSLHPKSWTLEFQKLQRLEISECCQKNARPCCKPTDCSYATLQHWQQWVENELCRNRQFSYHKLTWKNKEANRGCWLVGWCALHILSHTWRPLLLKGSYISLSHTVEAFGKELKQNPSHPCATKNSVIEMAESNAYTNSRN